MNLPSVEAVPPVNHYRVTHLVARDAAVEAARATSRQLVRLLAVSEEGTRVTAEWDARCRSGVSLTWSATGLTSPDMRSALAPAVDLRSGARPPRPARGSQDLAVFAIDADPGDPHQLQSAPIGFATDLTRRREVGEQAGAWSPCGIVAADELVAALRDAKAMLRVTATPAPRGSRAALLTRMAVQDSPSSVSADEYVGTPLAVELLVAVPGPILSARLKAIIATAVPHIRFRLLGRLSEPEVHDRWTAIGGQAQVLPASVAQALLLVPAVHPAMAITGIGVQEPPAVKRPMRHRTGRFATLTLGRATGPSGARTRVALTPHDARRHTQIVGQTGAGKSTAAVTYALAAARTGHGVTFLDPHGSTVKRLLTLLSEEELERTFFISLADVENPVRAAMWPSLDDATVEQIIAELNALFREIFDPSTQGMVGARFERWFALNAKANLALLGRRASFDTIAALSSTVESTQQLARAIRAKDPETSRALMNEYGQLASKEYTELISWAASKMQRFTSVAALRETFGSGTDSLDFASRIANRDIVLVDLGMPTLGASASQMAGTLLLQQLWRAITQRGTTEEPADTHFLFVDEAQRFQHGALPMMLAEGRKFGLALTVAHQHLRQLVPEVREALEANTGTLIAFRASPNDTRAFEMRLGSEVALDLPRLSNLTALASVCVDGTPAPVCTLEFSHPRALRPPEHALERALERTRTHLVEPFRDAAPLSGGDALERLKDAAKADRDRLVAVQRERTVSLRSKYESRFQFTDEEPVDPMVQHMVDEEAS